MAGWKLNPPPGWPPPPKGWSPPPGWAPDPGWGPVPAGWRLWVATDPPRTGRSTVAGLAALAVIGLVAVAVPRQGLGAPPDLAGRFGPILARAVEPAPSQVKDHPEPTRTRRTVQVKQRALEERARRRAGRFRTCAALNAAYPHGLGMPEAVDRVTGSTRRAVTGFGRSVALYTANRRLDRDRDGIACERD